MKRLLSSFTAVLVVVALLLTVSPAANAVSQDKIHRAVKVVRNQIGDSYGYGSSGPNRFDCSGLIYYSYRKAGIRFVKRTSSQQDAQTRRIPRKKMRPGDLMFFYSGGRVYHVAVYTGWKNHRRQMIHASRPGTPVQRAVPWTNSWYPGTYRS